MLDSLRRHLSYANVMATVAVFAALGGSSYAAIALTKNSVKSTHIGKGQVKAPDIASNAVRSAKVKDRSLLAKDFKSGQLPQGPVGPPGPQGVPGAAGAAGTAVAYAGVQADGTLMPSTGLTAVGSKGITNAQIAHPNPGIYCFTPSFAPKNVVATGVNSGDFTGGSNFILATVNIRPGAGLTNCPGDATVRVRTVLLGSGAAYSQPALADAPFMVWFE